MADDGLASKMFACAEALLALVALKLQHDADEAPLAFTEAPFALRLRYERRGAACLCCADVNNFMFGVQEKCIDTCVWDAVTTA